MNTLKLTYFRVLSLLIFCGGLLGTAPAMALIQASMNSRTVQGMPATELSPLQRTHVIVLGTGEEFGFATFSAARLKAMKWLEIAPQDQILILAAGHKGGAAYLQKAGFKVQEDVNERLGNNVLVDRLSKQKRVASLEVYSHSNPPYGPVLDFGDTKDIRLYLYYGKAFHAKYASVKGNFTPDAFAVFYGCNSAWKAAPIFSLIWGIPVAGSLQGTEFQVLGKNNQYHVATKENYARYGQQSVHKVGFEKPQDCGVGCYRMRPANYNYSAYWGSFGAGLPFLKFFCVNPGDWPKIQSTWGSAYKKSTGKDWDEQMLEVADPGPANQENISPSRCLKSMAQFMISEPSIFPLDAKSDSLQYKQVVLDFLCPHTGDEAKTQDCMKKLAYAEMENAQDPVNLNFMESRSRMAQCTLQSCSARVVCAKEVQTDPKANIPIYPEGGCRVVNLAPSLTTTMLDEFKNYLSGFELLKNESRVLPLVKH